MELSAMYKYVLGALALAFGVLLGLTGCTASDMPQTNSRTAHTAGTASSTAVNDPGSIELPGPTPLHKFFMSPEEGVIVEQATDVLTARCMEKKGFAYEVPEYAQRLESAKRWNTEAESRLYGPTNARTAKRFGLGIDLSQDSNLEGDGEPRRSPSYLHALLGSDSGVDRVVEDSAQKGADETTSVRGGCLGEARLKITGSPNGLSREVGRGLWIRASVDAQASPQYDAVTDDYRACMKLEGYRVTAVLNDEGDTTIFKRDLATTKPSRAEIDFVLAQIRCKKQVDLVSRLHSIDRDYSARAVKRHRVALYKDRRHLDDVVRAARRVLRR
jgi:hypothetical protein